MANDCVKPLAHEALPLVASEGVVTKVSTTKHPKDDVRDVDHANDLIGVSPTDQKRCASRLRHAFQVRTELQRRRRCDRPRPMQLVARTR